MARTITLEVNDWPGHIAGQHVDVRLTAPDGYSAVRSYSIASAPNSERRVEITVDRLPYDEVSPYLTQQLVVGDRLELRGPIGGWFVWPTLQTEPIQLRAGGSDIVLLMAMIRFRVLAGGSAPFRLVYSARDPSAIFYRELQALSSPDSTVSPTQIGVMYMYTGAWVPDLHGTSHSEGHTYHVGPHVMIIKPHQEDLASLSRDGSDGQPYVARLPGHSKLYLVMPYQDLPQ